MDRFFFNSLFGKKKTEKRKADPLMHKAIFVGINNRYSMPLDVMGSKPAAIGKRLNVFQAKSINVNFEDFLSSKN